MKSCDLFHRIHRKAVNKIKFIFLRGVYVEKNTSRPANVRAQASALQQGAKPRSKPVLSEMNFSSACSHEAGTLAAHG